MQHIIALEHESTHSPLLKMLSYVCSLLVKILNDGEQNLGPLRVFRLCKVNFKPTCFKRNPEIIPIIVIQVKLKL